MKPLKRLSTALLAALTLSASLAATPTGALSGWSSPLPNGTIIDEFGTPRGSRFHAGIDIACPEGPAGGVSPIRAVHAGRVFIGAEQGYYGAGYGIFVAIDHGDGTGASYGHLASASVRAGDRVTQGQTIAICGRTDVYDAPAHLHTEVRTGLVGSAAEGTWFAATAVNPLRYYQLTDRPGSPLEVAFSGWDTARPGAPFGGGGLVQIAESVGYKATVTNPGSVVVQADIQLPCGSTSLDVAAGASTSWSCVVSGVAQQPVPQSSRVDSIVAGRAIGRADAVFLVQKLPQTPFRWHTA